MSWSLYLFVYSWHGNPETTSAQSGHRSMKLEDPVATHHGSTLVFQQLSIFVGAFGCNASSSFKLGSDLHSGRAKVEPNSDGFSSFKIVLSLHDNFDSHVARFDGWSPQIPTGSRQDSGPVLSGN
ncbi:hypothetical protein K474DRAFT_1665813, partial [Panus rudis PR-1116 ss-1]